MIVVNLNQSYREVLSGARDMEDATLGWWAGITDEAATRYGDSVAGVYKNRVVSVYETSGFERDEGGRIFFHGEPSDKHASLIGGPSPVKPWVRGQARPIQYIETVALGDAPVENNQTYLRADVGGYVLTVDTDGIATLIPPLGGVVTVVAPDESRIFKFPS